MEQRASGTVPAHGEELIRGDMVDERTSAALVTLLAWYREMGVDGAFDEMPTDWLVRGDRAPGADLVLASSGAVASAAPLAVVAHEPHSRGAPQRPPSAPAPAREVRPPQPPVVTPRALPTASPDAAETEARRIARQAVDLAALEAALQAFNGCALKATAKSLCFYRGAGAARVMFIGEAPGRDEDIAGRPFVGRAGQLLDRMLAAVGLSESSVHITNIVYWRPPGNRTPTPQEAQICRPFLERQIELVAPDFLVLLGGAAAKHLLDVPDGILKLRGKWRDVEVASRRMKAMATLHPAYLLRTPAQKRLAWRDLLALAAALDGAG